LSGKSSSLPHGLPRAAHNISTGFLELRTEATVLSPISEGPAPLHSCVLASLQVHCADPGGFLGSSYHLAFSHPGIPAIQDTCPSPESQFIFHQPGEGNRNSESVTCMSHQRERLRKTLREHPKNPRRLQDGRGGRP
jgi:hypothetical protein